MNTQFNHDELKEMKLGLEKRIASLKSWNWDKKAQKRVDDKIAKLNELINKIDRLNG